MILIRAKGEGFRSLQFSAEYPSVEESLLEIVPYILDISFSRGNGSHYAVRVDKEEFKLLCYGMCIGIPIALACSYESAL